ncbi:MAG: ferritin-like domain-containing protein [Actinomycetota bacterium]|nr:ferritin-like domain-containing protein [Actinomycetota bacterium]
MTTRARSTLPTIDLEDLGLDRGGQILLKRALAPLAAGSRLEVRAQAAETTVHLRAWCRANGHAFEAAPEVGGPVVGRVVRGTAVDARLVGAQRAGGTGGEMADKAESTWGLAARGALVEAGGPEFRFNLDTTDAVWADTAASIYRQAVAAQWDPATAIDWDAPIDVPPDVETAVISVMTYLVENENAALVVPARFLSQVHPHFREVVGVLAVQVADEARHVEVFTRRAQMTGRPLGLSSAGGQASLQTLVDEPDFAVAHFLLSVLGEGTFLSLLSFLERHAPDPVTRQVTRLALADEARHVAFGLAHLEHVLAADPAQRGRLATAVRRRHDALADTAGLNEEVFDALVVLAAGSWELEAVATGFARVQALEAEMADGRRRRMVRLGFTIEEADELSSLHTRNFM